MGPAPSKTTRPWTSKKFPRVKTRKRSLSTMSSASTLHSDSSLYVLEGNRRYFRAENASYLMPVDLEECDRTVLVHFLIKAAWNGTNFSAPVKPLLDVGGRVLDIGCGAGSWLFDMASENPNATFVGLDLAELHPTTIKPANVQFVHANIMNGIPFPDDSFEFVYMRHMWTSIPAAMWPTVIGELVRVTRSGGWIEINDPSGDQENRGPFTTKYSEFVFDHVLRTAQIDLQMASQVPRMLAEAGRVHNLQDNVCKIPVGMHGGQLGKAMYDNRKWFMTNLKGALRNADLAEADQLFDGMLLELRDGNTWDIYHRICAQKI